MAGVGLMLPDVDLMSRREAIAVVQRAEELGYDSVWVGEAWGRDAVTALTEVAVHTHTIRLGFGILNVYSRTPALIAQTTATLDEISGGRVVLGLGTSGPTVVESWHGVPYRSPLQRTRECIEVVRLALSGERVDYEGRIFRLRGFRLRFRPPRPVVPIYVAALGPHNLRLTGELADGWLPIYLWPERVGEFQRHLEVGARVAGRSLADVVVAPYTLACVNEDGQRARDLIRQHLAYYVGGMGTFYAELVGRYGFAAEVEAVRRAWAQGDRTAAAAHVSDALVDALSVAGEADQCRWRLATYHAQGVHLPIVVFPHGSAPE
ncbi:MAG: LLM class flavin-dependent oxidoreductase, partial [Dehalococcoidia bacterium]